MANKPRPPYKPSNEIQAQLDRLGITLEELVAYRDTGDLPNGPALLVENREGFRAMLDQVAFDVEQESASLGQLLPGKPQPGEGAGPVPGDKIDMTEFEGLQALAEEAAGERELSDEERVASQEATSGLTPDQKAIFAMIGAGEGQLPGALSGAGAFGGNLEDPVYYEQVYAHFVRMFPDQRSWLLDLEGTIEGAKPAEQRKMKVEEFLRNSPDLVGIALSDFLGSGLSDLQFVGDVKVDGYNLVDLSQIAQMNEMTMGEARRLARWGKERLQIEPELFIPAYALAQDAGTFAKDETDGLTETVATLRRTPRKVYTLHHGEAFDKWGKNLAKGLELYDSTMLAMVYAHDPDLAQRMATQWYTITPDEATKISKYVGDADKLVTIPGVKQAEVDWYKSVMEGSGNFQLVDERAVLDAARTIVGSWNMTLGEPQLNNLLSQWKTAQARTLQSQNPFKRYDQQLIQVNAPQDEGAFLRETLRSTGEYGQLFGNKSTAETEQEYVNRFESKSQEFLGDQNIGAVRAGMMSGDPNTVVGQAVASGKAYDSSRFRGRLATMADTFRSMT